MTYVGRDVVWSWAMELFIQKESDQIDNLVCTALGKKTKLLESTHPRLKWRIAFYLVEMARKDQMSHRVVIVDAWYANIPGFAKNSNLTARTMLWMSISILFSAWNCGEIPE